MFAIPAGMASADVIDEAETALDDAIEQVEAGVVSDAAENCDGVPVTSKQSTNGADTLSYGGAANVINGLRGGDTITVDGGADKLCGGGGNDTLNGGSGADLVKGGSGADIVRGGGRDDELRGSSGADRMVGGTGNDTLVGGGGNDTYYDGYNFDTINAVDGVSEVIHACDDSVPDESTWELDMGGGAFDSIILDPCGA